MVLIESEIFGAINDLEHPQGYLGSEMEVLEGQGDARISYSYLTSRPKFFRFQSTEVRLGYLEVVQKSRFCKFPASRKF